VIPARGGIGAGVAGIERDPETLLPVVADEALASAAAAGDAGDRVVVLLARGDYVAAGELVAEARLADPQDLRLRMLDADVVRASGDPHRAITRLRGLLEEFAGTDREADLHELLGVLHHTTHDHLAAAHRFRRAVDLRIAHGEGPEAVEATRRLLRAAERRAGGVR
jgi:Flp pilus assembly protein TadD